MYAANRYNNFNETCVRRRQQISLARQRRPTSLFPQNIVIDKIVLSGGALESLDLRFEQHCEGGSAALHGQIHWNKADVTGGQPTAPAPIPAGLWSAGAGTVPASGNYLYLESTQGDFIGAGRTYGYNPSNAMQRYLFHNAAKGGMSWSGNGRGCNTLSGWFAVDSVSYSLGQLTAIGLRFEQHCEGGAAAQRGVIHWVR